MVLPFLCTILTVTISFKGYLGLKIRETGNNNKSLTGGACYGMRWGLGLVFFILKRAESENPKIK
jgi:hypothetical protein